MPGCTTATPLAVRDHHGLDGVLLVLSRNELVAVFASGGWPTNPDLDAVNELLQRCRSRVGTALAIDVMRLGLQRDLRKICQDFRRATPRSTGARVAARERLRVFSVGVSSFRGLCLMPVVSYGPAPW